MYYLIRVWDKNNVLADEKETVLIEDLPAMFADMDSRFPEADGYFMRVMYIVETFQGLTREEFREAAESAAPGNVDETIQSYFDKADEEIF